MEKYPKKNILALEHLFSKKQTILVKVSFITFHLVKMLKENSNDDKNDVHESTYI